MSPARETPYEREYQPRTPREREVAEACAARASDRLRLQAIKEREMGRPLAGAMLDRLADEIEEEECLPDRSGEVRRG